MLGASRRFLGAGIATGVSLELGDRRTKRKLTVVPIVAIALLGLPATAPAGAKPTPAYTLTDVGTLGGPQDFLNLPGEPLTRQGAVIGTADTTTPDEDFPNFNPFIIGFPNPTIARAFVFKDGGIEDLGALPGNNSSVVFQLNGSGTGAGMSETEEIDPFTGWPVEHATIFKNGRVIDLGSLPGGYESQAISITDGGQVAGVAQNGIEDPLSFFGWGGQVRSFVWRDGRMSDIGTLGGPDAVMAWQNARGQVAGDSYIDATPNQSGFPTLHPYLWTRGKMRDLGSLGGEFSQTNWVNDAGQVVGFASLPGEESVHPFLWDGARLRDLGTLGGSFGLAFHVNPAGHVVGLASTTNDAAFHAFLWRDGRMSDLSGADSPDCTVAEALNTHDQVVGHTCDETVALLWTGGTQYDLTSLTGATGVQLTEAVRIDDQGRIVAEGLLADGNQRLFLLEPTGAPLPVTSILRRGSHPSGMYALIRRSTRTRIASAR
jgi:probable HAF family extracellular repeat protein